MRGTKKKDPEAQKLAGNPGHRAAMRPAPTSDPAELPTPPEYLDKLARAEWDRLAPLLHRQGTLTRADRGPFAAYCAAYAHAEAAEKAFQAGGSHLMVPTGAGNMKKNPLLTVIAEAQIQMRRIEGEFGMSPVSRYRMNISGTAPEVGGLAAFLDGGVPDTDAETA